MALLCSSLADYDSFGFGGTNAHAILESYHPLTSSDTPKTLPSGSSSLRPFTPYVFSAMSERSLKANLHAYVAHLEDLPATTHDASSLAYTLRKHRSVFPYRASFSSSTIEDLKTDIQTSLEDATSTFGIRAQARSGTDSNTPKILGVFTGQGAQYPRMGASLIEESPLAAQIVETLESYLSQLPEADRPSWSLKSELLASSSRVHEAAISQPLCTAVQILLVDLLRTANIQFGAIVGHSSGEIAAAYAAGYLTARDAIVVAFYRGLHCRQAASPNGDIKGAMLAVGTSMEDATDLCQDEWFAGRVCVAACNSPSSVTISGDEDAIEQLASILDDEKKFNRRLKVDQAYHSSHMLPCAGPYIESLRRANIEPQVPSATNCCRWYSSVHSGNLISPVDKLDSMYWVENQTNPVLFSQALSAALSDHGVFDLVLEVGAHPALKGPSSETIQNSLNQTIPYHGCLGRGKDAVVAMSSCLGFLWSHLENNSVDLNKYEIAVSGRGNSPFKLLKGLPTYQWSHETKYWHESRRSQRMRLRKPSIPLLGDESPESSPHHLRWKNFLIPRELPWLEGHQVQGQIVFPAAGYVSTALEAARQLAAGKEIRLIEIREFQIHQAITFDGDTSAVEILIELSDITKDKFGALHSKFAYSAVIGGRDGDFRLVADGIVRVILDAASPDVLPKRAPATPHLIDVEPHRLYGFMESLGYNFRAQFRSLSKLRRKSGKASCEVIPVPPMDTENSAPILLHPAEIDAAFQSIMLAYSYPGDDGLRNLHLPARLATIRVNPTLCAAERGQGNTLSADSRLDHAKPASGFSGHVNMYTPGCDHAALQVEGLEFVPFAGAINEDRNVFYKMAWVHAAPDGASAADGIPVTQQDTELLWVLSRIASFFLRTFDEDVPEDSPARTEVPLCHYLNYARHMTGLLRNGKHKYAKTEWLTDSFEDVLLTIKEHG
jgi:acyl transferase domain-containing protein